MKTMDILTILFVCWKIEFVNCCAAERNLLGKENLVEIFPMGNPCKIQ